MNELIHRCLHLNGKAQPTKKNNHSENKKINMELKSFQVVAFIVIYWHFAWFVENCHFIDDINLYVQLVFLLLLCLVFIESTHSMLILSVNRTFLWLNFKVGKKCNINTTTTIATTTSSRKWKWLSARSKSNEEKEKRAPRKKRTKSMEIECSSNGINVVQSWSWWFFVLVKVLRMNERMNKML